MIEERKLPVWYEARKFIEQFAVSLQSLLSAPPDLDILKFRKIELRKATAFLNVGVKMLDSLDEKPQEGAEEIERPQQASAQVPVTPEVQQELTGFSSMLRTELSND